MATGDAVTFMPTATQAAIPCCLCGTVILPNPANMCANCIRSQVDIAEGIQKQVTIVYCKSCGRYLVPPKQWIRAELESKELLTFCIKRIKGLQKVKLIDASFIWTEPHSKRIKVKLTIQGEAYSGVMLQQTLVVDFQVEWNMCVDCNRANTNVSAWKSVAQVRQHVSHKRTFMFLEQLIVKHGAHEQCLNIKECHQGLDFYFGNRSHAQKFVDFLQNVVPAKFRHDKQLVSHDTHSASYNYRYTFSVEIAPICKDDLICLPPKLSQKHGQIGPLLLCTKISNAITLMCPYTLQVTHIDVKQFYNNPFSCIAGSRQLTRYIVLDIEPLDPEAGRHKLAEAQVARESDFGKNNTVFMCRTHLGRFLQPGDVALGYDLARFVNTDDNLEASIRSGYQAPDLVLVKKCFDEVRAKRRAQQRPRNYKLRQLAKEMEDANNAHAKRAEAAEAQRQEDFEQFMDELEEDPELRQQVSLYKNEEALAYQPKNAFASQNAPQAVDNAVMEGASDDEEDVDAAALDIPLDELLDDLDALNMEDEE